MREGHHPPALCATIGHTARMTRDATADLAHLRETLRSRRTVFEGRLLRVQEDEVELPDGGLTRREVVDHPGAVAVVAVDGDGVVLVRQWRHAVADALWELPAGTRDPDEDPGLTARRELAEETGYTAARWTSLGSGFVSPGYSGERMWLYLAEGLSGGTATADPDERLDVQTFTDAAVAGLVADGDTDLKTIAGIALAGRLRPAARR